MARVKKNDNDIKRIQVQMRFTADDKRTLQEFAKLAGTSVTDFVKSRTLGKPPRTKMATPDREVLIRLMSELSKIGSNVNQIAKAMNTNKKGYSMTIKETYIADSLESIRTVSVRLLSELDKTHTEAEIL